MKATDRLRPFVDTEMVSSRRHRRALFTYWRSRDRNDLRQYADPSGLPWIRNFYPRTHPMAHTHTLGDPVADLRSVLER